MHTPRILLLLHTVLLFTACISCSDDHYHERLLQAEAQVTQNTDSCATLLATIPIEELNQEDRALHGLVSSWMLYRQYAKVIPEEPLAAAFNYYHDSKDPHRRAQVYFLRAVICQDQKRGQPSQWMEDLYTACLAIEHTEDHLLASQIYQNYGSRLTQINRFDEARLWLDKFVEAAQQSGHRDEYVQALIMKSNNSMLAEEDRLKKELQTNDGRIIAQHTRFDEAFACIYKALAIARQHHMPVELGRIYNQLSLYHSRCQQSDSTLHYARLSVQLNEQLYAQGQRKELPHYLTLADAHRKLGNADSAIYFALATYNTPGMPLRNRRTSAQLLYNIYDELLNDYQTSLHWMRITNQLNDSINQTTIVSNLDAVQNAVVREQEKSELRTESQHTIHWLIWTLIIGALVIAEILFHLFRNRKRYRNQILEQEQDFNRRIADMHARMEDVRAKEADKTLAPEDGDTTQGQNREPEEASEGKIVLTGSTREQIEVDVSSILCLTSESNYVKVLHLDAEGRLKSKMLRQTMNNIESQLNAYSSIIRCHRAFIVNLQHVSHAATSASGLLLWLDTDSLQVPVSKTYISLVKSSLH